MATKNKRLQIRLTDEELDGITRRAKAAGLSVAEYGRTRMLAMDVEPQAEPMSLEFGDSLEGEPGPSYATAQAEAEAEGDEPLSDEVKEQLAKNGIDMPDWTPDTPGSEETEVDLEAPVKDLSPEDKEELRAKTREIVEAALDDTEDSLDAEECDVQGVPPGVRCIKCGQVHGS